MWYTDREEVTYMLAKKAILEALDALPEEVSYQQLLSTIEDLQFAEDIRRGLDEIARGDVYDAEEVFRELLAQ